MDYSYRYEIEPEIEIAIPSEELWNFLVDVEKWWVNSNPEHDTLIIDDADKKLRTGTKLIIREKIAGIPCKAAGSITGYEKNSLLEWNAAYYVLGLNQIRIDAGVRWKIQNIRRKKCTLSAQVWAKFPKGIRYHLLWFFFKYITNGIKKDYDHAMKELVYIKSTVESDA